MYAITRNLSHIYMHDPQHNMRVPITICLTDLTYEVRAPTADALEDDYVTLDIQHVEPLYRDIVAEAMQASMRYTVLFGDQLEHLTIGEIRSIVEEKGL